ncbi:MAG TPA: translocation/assembly module TamB domain-containing protein [Longimicrobiales bacterium]
MRGWGAAALALGLGIVGCREDDSGIPRYIPEIPAPPPLEAAARAAWPAKFSVRLAGVRAVVGVGVTLDLPEVEAVVRVARGAAAGGRGAAGARGAAEPAVVVDELVLRRPDVTFPIDTIVTPLNFFIEILEPRLVVRRLVVEDGRVGELAAPGRAPGRWLWRMRGVDLVAKDVRLGGRGAGRTEGLDIVRANAVGEIRGRPIELRGLALEVERDSRFVAAGTVRLPATRVEADLVATRDNLWTTTLAADTFAFRDLVALVPPLERAAPGGGAGVLTLSGGQQLAAVDIAWLRAASGKSFAAARGGIGVEPGRRVRAFRVEAAPVFAEDIERVVGVAIPGGGAWTGWLAADGGFREGVAVRAALDRRDDAGRVSRFAVHGAIIVEPEPILDLALRAAPLRVADTAFAATLEVVGPAARLAITGDAVVVGVEGVAATFDARLVDGPDAAPRLSGRAVVVATPEAVRRLAGVEEPDDDEGLGRIPPRTAPPPPASPARPPAAEPAVPPAAPPNAPSAPSPPRAGAKPAAPPAPPTAPAVPPPPRVGTEPAAPQAAPPSAPTGPSPPPPAEIVAEAEGSAVLAEGGAIDVTIAADSLPLALVPWPEAVDSVRGVVRGRGRIGGTLGAPSFTGRFALDDGAFFIEPLSLPVEEISAEARLVDGLVVVDTLGAAAGGGDIVVTGTVRVFDGPRRFDLALHADSVNVKDDEEGDVTASADLALAGPFERPALTGRVYDLVGWVHEDAFREDPLLDLDDPPYAELARRVPWPDESELRRRAEDDAPPPIDVRILIEVDTAFTVIDEDSELYGAGAVLVVTGEEDIETRGTLEVAGGFYAFFGERFEVRGGMARFEGEIEPTIAIKAEHREDWAIGAGEIATATAARSFPPLEFLAIGPAAQPDERLTRWSLLPETQDQLASLLIFDLTPQPVTGWRRDPVWRPSEPGDRFDERSHTQSATLLWSYIADEAYDYIPLDRGWLQAGTIQAGPGYPARVAVGPMLGAGAILGRFEVFVTQALDGALLPGVRVRANGFAPFGARLEAFSVPRFYADAPGGDGAPGFFVRRKTGIGLFWEWEHGAGGRGVNRRAPPGNPPPR